MKSIIILSPSKEMDFTPGDRAPAMDVAAKKILNALQSMTEHELAAQLQLKKEQARIIYDAYQNAALPTAKAAADTYRGLAFRQMDREILLSPFARDKVRILSALYGPIAPDAPINPYRLDFTKSLNVEGESLKSLQKRNFTEQLANCRIYNLASKEFSERIDRKRMAQWIDVEFYMDPNMKKRAPSATCKKLRGQLAAHLIAMESFEEKAFATFRYDGFHLLSSDEQGRYVYTR